MPVIVVDAGQSRSVSFRLALEGRGWPYVMALDPKRSHGLSAPSRINPFTADWDRRGCSATAKRPGVMMRGAVSST